METLQIKMEPEVKAFMDINSQMNKNGIHIPIKVFYLWQMLDQIQMAHNSLFASEQHLILMKSTPYLEELFQGMKWLKGLKIIPLVHKTNL